MKRRRISIVLTLMIVFVIAAGCITSASAATRKTDVSKAAKGNTLVLFEGKYTYLAKSKILAKINKIRKEACEEGVRDPRDESKKLKKSDYKAIKWSRDLEWIAQTRAAEGTMFMHHIRPNWDYPFDIYRNGICSYGEILAWNWDADILLGVDQWYDEKADWVKKNEDAETGHYTSIIDPDNTYIGLGGFRPTTDEAIGTVAGEFSSETKLDETQAKSIGKCNQVIEVADDHLSFSVKVPSKVHIGKSVQGSLKMRTAYPEGVWQISVPVKPVGGITWTSSNKNVATVTAKGKIKSVKTGKVTITVSASGRTFKKTVQVEGHKWKKKYTIDKKPTLAAKGSKSIHCTGCSVKKPGSTVSIPKLTLPAVKITTPKAGKKAITVKWKKIAKANRKKIAGIEIQISKSKKFKNAKTVKGKTTATSKKISKLSKKKKYYVRVRTWKKWKGKKYVSKWSSVKSVKTK